MASAVESMGLMRIRRVTSSRRRFVGGGSGKGAMDGCWRLAGRLGRRSGFCGRPVRPGAPLPGILLARAAWRCKPTQSLIPKTDGKAHGKNVAAGPGDRAARDSGRYWRLGQQNGHHDGAAKPPTLQQLSQLAPKCRRSSLAHGWFGILRVFGSVLARHGSEPERGGLCLWISQADPSFGSSHGSQAGLGRICSPLRVVSGSPGADFARGISQRLSRGPFRLLKQQRKGRADLVSSGHSEVLQPRCPYSSGLTQGKQVSR